MMSVKGFNEIFDEELKKNQRENKNETYKKIFEDINYEYFKEFGCYRYASYDSFDRVRRRMKL